LRRETEIDFTGPELVGHHRRRTLVEAQADLRVLGEELGRKARQDAQRLGRDRNAATRETGGIV